MQQFVFRSQNICNLSRISSQNFSKDTLDNIKKSIDLIQRKLNKLIEIKMPNISDSEILKLSQELDSLIYIYMRASQRK